LGGGAPEDSAGSEGKLEGIKKPTKYLCRQSDGRVKVRCRGLVFSAVTSIQIDLLEEEQRRETKVEIYGPYRVIRRVSEVAYEIEIP
jgi:hypothetical protein